MTTPSTVDDYIAAQPDALRCDLEELRSTIRRAVPDAIESVSYGMPTYTFANGHPVYFAGWKRHISLHDIPVLPDELEARMAPYRSGKDTVKFPHGTAIAFDLVEAAMVAISQR